MSTSPHSPGVAANDEALLLAGFDDSSLAHLAEFLQNSEPPSHAAAHDDIMMEETDSMDSPQSIFETADQHRTPHVSPASRNGRSRQKSKGTRQRGKASRDSQQAAAAAGGARSSNGNLAAASSSSSQASSPKGGSASTLVASINSNGTPATATSAAAAATVRPAGNNILLSGKPLMLLPAAPGLGVSAAAAAAAVDERDSPALHHHPLSAHHPHLDSGSGYGGGDVEDYHSLMHGLQDFAAAPDHFGRLGTHPASMAPSSSHPLSHMFGGAEHSASAMPMSAPPRMLPSRPPPLGVATAAPLTASPPHPRAAASPLLAEGKRRRLSHAASAADASSPPSGQSTPLPKDGAQFVSAKQKLAWSVNDEESWLRAFDADMKAIPVPGFRVEVDKGLKQSSTDQVWVCQKKNHFQLTVTYKWQTPPAFVATPDGLKKVAQVLLHMYGVKMEAPKQRISLEQSQADRTKTEFAPVAVKCPAGELVKKTIGRLHFCETTANNMRKKGKPNPDQRYFALVVSLVVRCEGSSALYTIASHKSDRLIVRASNPGLFETTNAVAWGKGESINSIYHEGAVGINTSNPSEALSVHGNIRLSGSVMQPSDVRLKEGIARLDSSQQLLNINRLNLYKYRLRAGWAAVAERTGAEDDWGVLAQEVQQVLPEAVKTSERVVLADGSAVDDLLVVNKDRLYLEGLGAVQELSRQADAMAARLAELEAADLAMRRAVRRSSSLLELRQQLGMMPEAEDGQESEEKAQSVERLGAVEPTARPGRPDESQWLGLMGFVATAILVALLVAFCLNLPWMRSQAALPAAGPGAPLCEAVPGLFQAPVEEAAVVCNATSDVDVASSAASVCTASIASTLAHIFARW